MRQVRHTGYLRAANFQPYFFCTKLVLLLTLVAFLLAGGAVVTSARVFVSMAVLNALQVSILIMVPEAVRSIAEFSSVFQRMEVSERARARAGGDIFYCYF